MSYIALYRKWRSQNFDEIVGQKAIVQTLKNAILNDRLSHAYLFSGPRGTGKTSTARILAKALNCEKGPTPAPCGKCDQCEKITLGHSVNVIEIDAASNRGIDQIRDLREKIRYAPVEGRYKVYIIDEVHMLTPEAFNALLKTLEEPPAYTIFVLATTEIQKVPVTILSRCQRLDFGRIALLDVKDYLMKMARVEGFAIEDKAVELIARTGEGSLRDSISLLDQLVSFSGKTISYDDVVLLLGTADEELLFKLSDSILEGNIAAVLELIKKAIDEGKSVVQATRDLIMHFRNMLHVKVGSDDTLELTHDHLERLKKQVANFSIDRIKEILQKLSRAEIDMKWHPYARIVLEVTLMELLGESRKVAPPAAGQARLETPIRAAATVQPSDDGLLGRVKNKWKDILEDVKRKSVFGYVSLHEGEPIEINAKGKLVIGFKKGYAFHKERLEEVHNRQAVEDSIRESLGTKVMIECVIQENIVKSPSISADAVADFFEGKVLQS